MRAKPNGAAVGKLQVLVVDDSADTVASLLLLLKLWGHSGEAAHDGLAALDAARRHRPDVVLLDLGMPGMSGYEVARQLRKEPGLEQVILIAATGHGQADSRRRCREVGFDALLLKPFDPEELRQYLAAGLE
jgi:two-component system CheB/CheR fusion protein